MSGLCTAMMVTQPARKGFALEAFGMLRAQTYAQTDIVIVNPDPPQPPVGTMRNTAMQMANGVYVAQWDDDDRHHRERLAAQIEAIEKADGVACFLTHETVECCCGRRVVVPANGMGYWHHSMVAKRLAVYAARYADTSWAEDLALVRGLVKRWPQLIVGLEAPELYTYRFHGGNIVGAKQFDRFFERVGDPHRPSQCYQGAS